MQVTVVGLLQGEIGGKKKESRADMEERNLVALCHFPSGKSV